MAPSILGLASAILGIPTITTFIQNLISALTRNSEYIENVQCTRNQLQEFEDEDLLGKMSILLTPTAYSDGSLNTVIPPYQETLKFSGFSSFSVGSSWEVENDVATTDGLTFSNLSSPTNVVVGKKYRAVFTITGGSVRFYFGGSGDTPYTVAAGTHTLIGVAESNKVTFRNLSTASSISNFTLIELQEADFDFSRGSSATRVNEQGLVEDVQILSGELVQNGNFEQIGAEKVTNGTFETDSDWTKQTGWSISDGKAIATSTNGSFYQAVDFINGRSYKITFEITSYESGGLICRFNNDETNIFNSIGTHTLYFESDDSFNYVYFLGNSFTGSIDNVSAKEVGQNWSFYNSSSNTNTRFEDNAAVLDASANQFTRFISSSSPMTIGNLYRVTYEVIETDNTTISIQYPLTYIDSSLGVHTVDIVATNINIGFSKNTVGVVKIDNVSIKEVTNDTDLPRIDYSPYSGAGTCGHLLLEPQRTNLITYSENLTDSSWAKQSGGTGTAPIVTSNNTISPDGTQNADKVVFNKGTGTTTSDFSILSASFTSQSNTASFYVKADSSQRIVVRNSNTFVGYDIGTDWTRIEKTDTGGSIQIGLRDGYGVADVPNTATVYLWGVQVEAADYATSYIPTSGTTVTRSAELANNSGNADLFNDSEGVLYAEVKRFDNDTDFGTIGITDGSGNNQVTFKFRNTTNLVYGNVTSGGTNQVQMQYTASDLTVFNKLAIKYKENNFALWFNGVEVLTDTSGIVPTGLNELAFDNGSGANLFIGKTKCVAVFKEALSNDELELLTGEGYNSFAALAAAYNYNVI